MLDHVGLQVQDVEKSLDFYLRTFAAIGMHEAIRFPVGDTIVVGLAGPGGVPTFWLSPPTGTETRELHVAFRAPDRAAVARVALDRLSAAVGRPDPGQVWIVGDTPRDLACAQAIGVRCALVATGRRTVGELTGLGADIVLPDLADPRPLLDLWRR